MKQPNILASMPIDYYSGIVSILGKEEVENLDKQIQVHLQSSPTIFPSRELIFRALELTPLHDVRVVILGQDPYHGPGQAHGLSFSVPTGVQLPPSLKNIFKELHADLNIPPADAGDLTHWAQQGVLMLNAILTVVPGQPAAHGKIGWQTVTDAILALINRDCKHVVFILWGNYAMKKAALIDDTKHLILTASHPSPLGAYRGFYGSRPFSKANAYLQQHHAIRIDWQLPPLSNKLF